MTNLAHWASGICRALKLALAIFVFSLLFVGGAFAAQPPDIIQTISALYGPMCNLLLAIVILCERVARIIPNSTTSRVLKVLLLVTTILGLKVPDNQ